MEVKFFPEQADCGDGKFNLALFVGVSEDRLNEINDAIHSAFMRPQTTTPDDIEEAMRLAAPQNEQEVFLAAFNICQAIKGMQRMNRGSRLLRMLESIGE